MAKIEKSRATLYMFTLLLVAFLVLNIKMVMPYLLAVLIGAIIAILTLPIYQYLVKKRFGKKLSALIVTVAVTVLVIGPVFGLGAIAVDQATEFAQKLSSFEGINTTAITEKFSRYKTIQALVGDAKTLEQQLRSGVQTLGKSVGKIILVGVALLPDMVIQLVLALVATYFLLIDGKSFFTWLRDKIPLEPEVRTKLFNSFRDSAVSSTWATLTAAFVQSLIMLIAYLVLGMPAAILAAGATFFFAWIPVVGSTPVWMIGAIVLFAQHEPGKAIAMLIFGIVCGLSDNIVLPWVQKGTGNLHPLVSLVAIFGGIQMFGVMGVFIGPIVISILIALLKIWPDIMVKFGIATEPVKEVSR